MIKVNIEWANENGMHEETKSFKDEFAAVQWCRIHYKNIASINYYWTGGEFVSQFMLLDYITRKFTI